MLQFRTEWKNNSTGLNKKVCNYVTSTVLGKNWTKGTEVRWANTNWKELGQKREEKRVDERTKRWKNRIDESQESAQTNKGRWDELTRGDKLVGGTETWCKTLGQERRSLGKRMEVCRSSYRQTLCLDLLALHFLHLETSATGLARARLVQITRHRDLAQQFLLQGTSQGHLAHKRYPFCTPLESLWSC